MIETLSNIVKCRECGEMDTKAILDSDNYAGIIWCCCGYIQVNISAGMEVKVVRV